MAPPDLQAAARAALESIPPSHRKASDPILCPSCGQPVEEGGTRGGGGATGSGDEDGGGGGLSSYSPACAKTPQAIAAFLAALREYPLVNRAARAAGVGKSTVYDWRREDPDFRAAWAEALDEGVERIEEVTHRAAINDHTREGTLQRMFTLKRWRPEYRDNVTVSHQGGGQDARDAALLRRAMVEALGPYPEARAALAATLARLAAGAVATGDGPEEVAGVKLDHDIQAGGAELAAAVTSPPGADKRGDARGGCGDPGGGGGPVQAASTSTIPQEKGPIPDTEKIVDAEYEEVSDDDGGSGSSDQ